MASPEKTSGQEQPSPAQIWSARLETYMAGAEFKSPRYLALSNLLDGWYIDGEIDAKIKQLDQPDTLISKRKLESDIRIAEYQAALLRHQVQTRAAEIPGYEQAYYDLNSITWSLQSAYAAEIQKDYPDYTKEQANDAAKDFLHEQVMGKLHRIVGTS